MTNPFAPISSQNTLERVFQAMRRIIMPHASVTDPRRRRRVQLLNTFALIATLTLAVGYAMNIEELAAFRYAPFVSLAAFLLGKSKYPRVGVTLFSAASLSVPYILLYNGYASNYILVTLTFTAIALTMVNSLVTPKTFAAFTAATIIAAALAPFYSRTFILQGEVIRVIVVLLLLGILLISSNIISASVEASYQREIEQKHNAMQKAISRAEEISLNRDKEIELARQEISQRIERLNLLANIAQEIAANVNKPFAELLTYITQIMSERLGYYHVGIFLLDKKRQYAELRAANSEGGARMLKRNHQLKVGGTGIVGYVAQSGFPRIALSTGADAVFFNNPDLPNTQSEMALPLKIGSQVIGVLDVQSTQPAAFSEDEVHTFTALASQISFVIYSHQANQSPIQAEERKTSRQKIDGNERQNGYLYLADGTITASTGVSSPALEKALRLGQTITQPASGQNMPALAVPVKIRDSVIGYIHIEGADRNRKWSENEIALVEAVSERAALALENARLFEETERRAEQEKTIAEVTARIGETTSFEQVLKVTIQEIGRTLGARRAFIQMEPPASEKAKASAP